MCWVAGSGLGTQKGCHCVPAAPALLRPAVPAGPPTPAPRNLEPQGWDSISIFQVRRGQVAQPRGQPGASGPRYPACLCHLLPKQPHASGKTVLEMTELFKGTNCFPVPSFAYWLQMCSVQTILLRSEAALGSPCLQRLLVCSRRAPERGSPRLEWALPSSPGVGPGGSFPDLPRTFSGLDGAGLGLCPLRKVCLSASGAFL